jgi:hypothetical protein
MLLAICIMVRNDRNCENTVMCKEYARENQYYAKQRRDGA